MGRLGMSFADFCLLSPEEFAAAVEAHNETTEGGLRDAWERMRLLATISIQPHVKNKLKPRELIPLPWDNERPETDEAPIPTKEEALKRFKRLAGAMDKNSQSESKVRRS